MKLEEELDQNEKEVSHLLPMENNCFDASSVNKTPIISHPPSGCGTDQGVDQEMERDSEYSAGKSVIHSFIQTRYCSAHFCTEANHQSATTTQPLLDTVRMF